MEGKGKHKRPKQLIIEENKPVCVCGKATTTKKDPFSRIGNRIPGKNETESGK